MVHILNATLAGVAVGAAANLEIAPEGNQQLVLYFLLP
jgi:hypothetical protein